MKRILILSFTLFTFSLLRAQCPVLTGAMVNACGMSAPNTEGNNEFVTMHTAVSTTAGSYNLQYGTTTAVAGNNLSGQDATTPTGTGSFIGCSYVAVTSASQIIPANVNVIMIPSAFDHAGYHISSLCATGPVYIIFVNIAGGHSNWQSGGTFANSGTRYLSMASTAGGCTAPTVSYNTGGWSSNADGNFVGWNAAGTPSYSNNGCSATVVPVKFISLIGKAYKGFNVISWQVGEEINVEKYIVEYSYDGTHFLSGGSVFTKGSNAAYTFTDVSAGTVTVYYRVVSLDNDGGSTMSDVIKITNTAVSATINCYPNPVEDVLNAEWISSKISASVLIVTDAAGRRMITKKIIGNAGINKATLNTSFLAVGIYFLQVKAGKEIYTETFTKK